MAKEKKIEKKDKKRRFKRFSRVICFILFSIFLYFWSVGILRTILQYIQSDSALMGFPKPFFYFICSFCSSIVVITIFMNSLLKHYMYCHELTHALFGIITGSKVSKLKVNEDNASVNISHSNLIVALSPYIISLHTLMILFIYGCATMAFPKATGYMHNFFTIILGTSAAFHFVFTIKTLLQEQTDIERSGFFFSYLLITTLNLFGIAIILTCIDTISLAEFTITSIKLAGNTIAHLWAILLT